MITGYNFWDTPPHNRDLWEFDEFLTVEGVWCKATAESLTNSRIHFEFGQDDAKVLASVAAIESLTDGYFLVLDRWPDATYTLRRMPEENAGAFSGDYQGFLVRFAFEKDKYLACTPHVPGKPWWKHLE